MLAALQICESGGERGADWARRRREEVEEDEDRGDDRAAVVDDGTAARPLQLTAEVEPRAVQAAVEGRGVIIIIIFALSPIRKPRGKRSKDEGRRESL